MTLFLAMGVMIIASTLMYFAENAAQPNAFSSIPASLWWGISTLTTIGYGDIYPVTLWGKIISGCIALLGIGIVALPAGILSSALVEEIERKTIRELCPHCGKEIVKNTNGESLANGEKAEID